MTTARSLAKVLALAATMGASNIASSAPPLGDITAVSVGWSHACVIIAGGGLKCWGGNGWGELGDGTRVSRTAPDFVAGLTSGVAAVSAGQLQTCAVTSTGGVQCWGDNGHIALAGGGLLGVGSSENNVLVPTEVVGLGSGVSSVSLGGGHICALTTAGHVKCWGNNSNGQLGDGTTVSRVTPVEVAGLSGVVAISTGASHTCALTDTGGVKCWGYNLFGQVGDGTETSRSAPVEVVGLASGVARLAAGGHRSCVVTDLGGVKCWGYEPPVPTKILTPQDVAGATSGIADVGTGLSHACALTSGGAVKCWGTSANGELGTGQTSVLAPIPPTEIISSGITGIALGLTSSCAVTAAGTAQCWGLISGPMPWPVPDYLLQTIQFPQQPSRALGSGSFTPTATATSMLPIAYASNTDSVCSVSGSSVDLHAVGICTLRASQAGDSDWYPAQSVLRSFLVTGGAGARLVNLATRLRVGIGDNVGIAGFFIQSPQPKTVLVRARAASLGAFGLTSTLPNPFLSFHVGAGGAVFADNEDWQEHASSSLMADIGLAPSDPSESALIVTLQPNLPYTAIVQDRSGAAGLAIVEVFELDQAQTPLVNIATRGQVLTGDDVMIAGFIIGGTDPQTVVIRARGPSMAQFGVANLLQNPELRVYSGQTEIAYNDNWQQQADASAITASGLAPTHANEAALRMTLNPGPYTAIVSGVGGTTGVGIVEVLAVP